MTVTAKPLCLGAAPADEVSSASVHAWLPSVCHRTLSLQAQPLWALPDGPDGWAPTAAAMQLLLHCNFIFCVRKATSRLVRTSKICCCQVTGSPSAAPHSNTPPGCICINFNEDELMQWELNFLNSLMKQRQTASTHSHATSQLCALCTNTRNTSLVHL